MLTPKPSTRELTFSSLERTTLGPERARVLSAAAVHPVAFSIGSVALEVRFSEPRSAQDFVDRYADLPARPAPWDRPAALTLFVVERGDRTFFWADPACAWRWSDGPIEPELVGFFADAALHHEFMRTTPSIGFHAAVVALDGGCAAITGTTTAGKTTTAVACARQGLRLYSDERCIVQDGLVVPFLRRLTLRAGGRRALLADEPRSDAFTELLRAWDGPGEVGVRPSRLFKASGGGPPPPPLPLRCMFVIEGHGETPSLTPTTALAAAPSIVLSLSGAQSALDRIACLLRVLRGVEVYRLRLGRPSATAVAIKEVLTRAASTARR